MRKIALISEHASPLAQLGGTDSGGQHVYVGHVTSSLCCNWGAWYRARASTTSFARPPSYAINIRCRYACW
ncbi:hypothetical protein D3871_11690 [Noviherbaspirillum saxi]|uniref:Uncharacterized protein n=1 Tax=Noviherbaspirillum saxi TaxID=2320863 RepID=A0A3A3FY21_9BURK|nr:hypothetical protein D3871_11690 [Noviherbaspirillum saxi]